jgi:hypothetical protein
MAGTGITQHSTFQHQQSLSPSPSTSNAASLNSPARQWNMIAMSSIHKGYSDLLPYFGGI